MSAIYNPNFLFIEQEINRKRFTVLQGGTRSGKTYSVLLWIIRTCLKFSGLDIDIVRETMPALRMTAMKDFFEILQKNDLYNAKYHHKTKNQYTLNGNVVSFFGIDEPQKVRGAKRHLIFLNEANELSVEAYRQLTYRTTGRFILDYNPSMAEDHWIFSEVLTRPTAARLITTYKDNPYLTAAQIADIEHMRDVDPEYWKIFGLGVRGQIRGLVYPKWHQLPDGEFYRVQSETFYGIDFGFSSSQLAIVAMKVNGPNLYLHELKYALDVSNEEIIECLSQHVTGKAVVVADREMKSIVEIEKKGFNIHPADKSPGSVEFGIRKMKSFNIYVSASSVNLIKELRNYKWKEDLNNKQLPEPVKKFDHLLDAARYALVHQVTKRKIEVYATA